MKSTSLCITHILAQRLPLLRRSSDRTTQSQFLHFKRGTMHIMYTTHCKWKLNASLGKAPNTSLIDTHIDFKATCCRYIDRVNMNHE